MTREHDPCAMCARFVVPDDSGPTGYCTVWARATPWNGQIGVLFKEAKDRAPRARYVGQQQESISRASAQQQYNDNEKTT